MTNAKRPLAISVAVVLALLAGRLWGASAQSDTSHALQASELRGDLLGTRAAVLDARVAIYSVNFGEASGHLEGARGLLARALGRLTTLGRTDDVRRVETARTAIDDAQRMTGTLDQGANARAGDAAKILAEVLDSEMKQ